MAKKKPDDVPEPREPRVLPDPYPHATPRWLHKQGEADPLLVCSPEACADALDDGWVIHPDWPVN